jgi:hypothetical protein
VELGVVGPNNVRRLGHIFSSAPFFLVLKLGQAIGGSEEQTTTAKRRSAVTDPSDTPDVSTSPQVGPPRGEAEAVTKRAWAAKRRAGLRGKTSAHLAQT